MKVETMNYHAGLILETQEGRRFVFTGACDLGAHDKCSPMVELGEKVELPLPCLCPCHATAGQVTR